MHSSPRDHKRRRPLPEFGRPFPIRVIGGICGSGLLRSRFTIPDSRDRYSFRPPRLDAPMVLKRCNDFSQFRSKLSKSGGLLALQDWLAWDDCVPEARNRDAVAEMQRYQLQNNSQKYANGFGPRAWDKGIRDVASETTY